MKWGLRALLALSGALAVATLLVAVSASRDTVSGEALDRGTVTAPVRPDRETILWSADFETRDFAPWEAGGGGGIFNTGTGVASITSEVAHGGRHAAKLTISQASGTPQAVRIFRWAESERETEAYYSVWLYFPRRYEPAVWWNVFQFKSKTESRNDPMWQVDVGTRPNGEMFFYLYDGPNRKPHHQTRLTIPVGRWVHVEAFYKRSTGREGRITLWQDGVRLFDFDGVQTAIADNVQWSVDNYTDDITPSTATIYADDAVISRVRVGPRIATTRE